MKAAARKKSIQFVVENGKPAAVILDIREYRKMIERLEDQDDLRVLRQMKKRPLKFRKFEDFLTEIGHGV
jgi:prevent-host-death family protein